MKNSFKRGSSFSTTIAGRALVQPEYDIVVDPKAGLMVRRPQLKDDELAYYYANNDWRRHSAPRLFPTEVTLRGALVASLPPTAKILDVGCGDGRFAASLPDTMTKFGTELSGGAAAAAASAGVTIVNHEDVVAGKHGDFDAIVMIDVFEHLTDPHAFIQELLPRLRQGGLLGVATGDGDCPEVRKDPANHWYFRIPVHLCMWTEAYACYAENELGLQRVFVEKVSHYRRSTRLWGWQWLRKCAYAIFHDHAGRFVRAILARLPLFRRVACWEQRPEYWFARDHVVTVFRKL